MGGTVAPSEQTCDVIVVGSGACGLMAAIVAKSHGLDVRVLEGQSFIGGCSAYSHGMLWMPGNPVAARAGIADERAAALSYLQAEMGDYFVGARAEIESYLDYGPRMLEFLEQVSSLRFELRQNFPDYHSEQTGAAQHGRTILPASFDARRLGRALRRLRQPRTTLLGMSITPAENKLISSRSSAGLRYLGRRLLRHCRDLFVYGRASQLAGGNALMAGLLEAALARQVPIQTGARVQRLSWDEQRVTGVELESSTGQHWRLKARRGVILACGGFGQDADRCKALMAPSRPGRRVLVPGPSRL